MQKIENDEFHLYYEIYLNDFLNLFFFLFSLVSCWIIQNLPLVFLFLISRRDAESSIEAAMIFFLSFCVLLNCNLTVEFAFHVEKVLCLRLLVIFILFFSGSML